MGAGITARGRRERAYRTIGRVSLAPRALENNRRQGTENIQYKISISRYNSRHRLVYIVELTYKGVVPGLGAFINPIGRF